jgi:hypothetical protein
VGISPSSLSKEDGEEQWAAAKPKPTPMEEPTPAIKQDLTPALRLEGDWREVIVRKLHILEQRRRALAPSSTPLPTKDMYLTLANRLGNVNEMVNWLKEGTTEGTLTWKLVITALPPNGPLKPLVNFFARNQPFGVVHAAVQLGKHLIDWTTSDLVTPRFLKGKALMAALDLSMVSNVLPKVDDVLYIQIATVIVDWNRSKKYDRIGCNCQHFVDDLFKRGMGLNPRWPPAIANYLDALRIDSELGLPHYIDENGQRVFFESHKHLDQYVKDNNNGTFFTKDKLDLMKAFDRAYMVKWRTNSQRDPLSEPLNPTTELRCTVFGPLTTQ